MKTFQQYECKLPDHDYTNKENRALGFISNWDTDGNAADDYLKYRSCDHKMLDLAILYLYRLKFRTFMYYFSKVKDQSLFDDADEMIREALGYKFSNL